MAKSKTLTITDADYRALSEFRHHIRRYLDFTEQAARAAGIEAKQYQLLLAVRGLPEDATPTVGVLAEQLCVRHHSAVELIDRAEANDLVERTRAGNHVVVQMTKRGRIALERAVRRRIKELRVAGPIVVKTLQQLLKTKNQRGKRAQARSSSK